MNSKKYHVICSGYVSMDRIIKIKSPATVGFTSLVSNKTSAQVQYGGCAVNIAHNLCRLGLSALPVMRVGGDWEEIGFKTFLEEAGIPLDALQVLPEEITSQCYLIQDTEGQHITLFYPGAMDGRLATPLPAALFEQSQLALMTVGAREDNEIFFENCKRHNLPLILSMKGDMEAFPRDFLEELLHYSQVIFTNEEERATIEKMFGTPLPQLLQTGQAQMIITTLGHLGSQCSYKDEQGNPRQVTVPICSWGEPVDTTGCGDGYVSGFLYGYLQGKSARECAMLGAVHASFIIEKEGCCTAAPTQQHLEERMTIFAKQEGEATHV